MSGQTIQEDARDRLNELLKKETGKQCFSIIITVIQQSDTSIKLELASSISHEHTTKVLEEVIDKINNQKEYDYGALN